LTAIGLYLFAAAFIGYFGVNAFTGRHGLRAQADLDQQLASMQSELDGCRRSAVWGTAGGAAARPRAIDPDMLNERARALLGWPTRATRSCCCIRADRNSARAPRMLRKSSSST